MASCTGGGIIAESPECPRCKRVIDRFRDSITGRDVCFRFVPHDEHPAQPPAELVHAILNERPDLERILVGVLSDLGTVSSWLGDLTDARDLHVVQMQLANVTLKAEELETLALRLRMAA